jgi:hypothetical protein
MAELPEFIYRLGTRVKDLSLHRYGDYLTGLSFRDEPFGKQYLTLSVKTLLANGFVVRRDGGLPMTVIWNGEPYIEPNSGEHLTFDEGHVSVWHPEKEYFEAWHKADAQNYGKPEVSKQLAFFALAIVHR